MKNYLTPIAIIFSAIIISITIYVALTKPKNDMINKRMETCINNSLNLYGVKNLNELEKIELSSGETGKEFVMKTCKNKIYKWTLDWYTIYTHSIHNQSTLWAQLG